MLLKHVTDQIHAAIEAAPPGVPRVPLHPWVTGVLLSGGLLLCPRCLERALASRPTILTFIGHLYLWGDPGGAVVSGQCMHCKTDLSIS